MYNFKCTKSLVWKAWCTSFIINAKVEQRASAVSQKTYKGNYFALSKS